MTITVYMRSDEFGYEEFPRDTIDEALETIKSLRQSALDQDDGIEREIGLKVNTVQERLEYLRGRLRAESISYGELAELQSLVDHIDEGDVELLEAAGVPESDVVSD